jgi:hypothetical protein
MPRARRRARGARRPRPPHRGDRRWRLPRRGLPRRMPPPPRSRRRVRPRCPPSRATACPPRELPGVRRHDHRCVRGGRELERPGIDDDRHTAREQASERLGLGERPGCGIRARPHHPRVDAPIRGHRLGSRSENELTRRTGVADHSDSRPPGALDAQHRGARIHERTRTQSHDTAGILVIGVGWPPKDPRHRGDVDDSRSAHGVTLAARLDHRRSPARRRTR